MACDRWVAAALAGVVAAFSWGVACAAGGVGGSESSDVFQARFGADCKKAAATVTLVDDVALAARILEAAKAETARPDLAVFFCERAYEWGAKAPAGYGTAVEAMQLAAATVSERRMSCLEKVAAIRQKEMQTARGPDRGQAADGAIDALLSAANLADDAGDTAAAVGLLKQALAVALAVVPDRGGEVQARLDRQTARQRASALAAALRKRLEANPKEAPCRKQLVMTLLLDLDAPAQAAVVLDDSCDPTLRKYVPAAARSVEEVPELASLELAEWYRGLSESAASPWGKATALGRAKGYYARYLALHVAQDADRDRAKTLLEKTGAAMAGLAPRPAPGPWVDILSCVDAVRDGLSGQWELRSGALRGGAVSAWAGLYVRCAPQGNYEVEIAFMRTGGRGDVAVFIPVGAGRVGVMLSRAVGTFSDLTGVPNTPGEGATLGTRREPGLLSNNQVYQLRIQVFQDAAEAEVCVALNEQPYLHWKGPPSLISSQDRLKLPDPRGVGLGAYDATVVFRTARVRPLGGRVRSLK